MSQSLDQIVQDSLSKCIIFESSGKESYYDCLYGVQFAAQAIQQGKLKKDVDLLCSIVPSPNNSYLSGCESVTTAYFKQ